MLSIRLHKILLVKNFNLKKFSRHTAAKRRKGITGASSHKLNICGADVITIVSKTQILSYPGVNLGQQLLKLRGTNSDGEAELICLALGVGG